MSILDFLFKKQAGQANTLGDLFSFFYNKSAPDMKGKEYLQNYIGWVYACVSAIAEDVSTMELVLKEKSKDGYKIIDDVNHPVLKPLYSVNDFMSSGQLLYNTAAYGELEGNAFWYLARNLNGEIREIWSLDPTRVSIIKDEKTFIGGYEFRKEDGGTIRLAVDEVIPFKRFNPLDQYRGMGTLAAAAMAVDVDRYASQWNRNFFFNSALPSGVIEYPSKLKSEQAKTLREMWNSLFQGIGNSNKTAVLTDGAKFNKLSLSQKDMDFLEQRRFSRDEILGIFKVPKTVLGIVEDVNRANAEATEYVFAKRVIKPRMNFIVDHLNEFYLPLFGAKYQNLRFTFKDPVPQNIELDLKRKNTGLAGMPWLTINEVRKEEGLAPVADGDKVYINFSLSPMGAVQDQEKATAADVKKEAEKLNNISKDVKDTIDKLGMGLGIKPKMDNNQFIEKRVKFIREEIGAKKKVFTDEFMKQKKYVLGRLKKKKSIMVKADKDDLIGTVFDDWESQVEILYNPVEETLRESLKHSGQHVLDKLNINISFDLKAPRVKEWLEKYALEHCTSIADSFKDEVKRLISQSVDDGLGMEAIAEKIGNFYDDQAEWRALRVARTEVISGYAKGTLEGAVQSGVVRGKKWLTANDDRVEEECLRNQQDGEIGLDDSFSSGDSAPPVHPNCRCVLQEVVKD